MYIMRIVVMVIIQAYIMRIVVMVIIQACSVFLCEYQHFSLHFEYPMFALLLS